MSEVAIRVAGLGKRYRLGQLEPFKALRTKLTNAIRSTSGRSDTVYDAALMEVWGSDFYPSRHVPPRTMGEVLFEHEWEMANSAKEPA